MYGFRDLTGAEVVILIYKDIYKNVLNFYDTRRMTVEESLVLYNEMFLIHMLSANFEGSVDGNNYKVLIEFCI